MSRLGTDGGTAGPRTMETGTVEGSTVETIMVETIMVETIMVETSMVETSTVEASTVETSMGETSMGETSMGETRRADPRRVEIPPMVGGSAPRTTKTAEQPWPDALGAWHTPHPFDAPATPLLRALEPLTRFQRLRWRVQVLVFDIGLRLERTLGVGRGPLASPAETNPPRRRSWWKDVFPAGVSRIASGASGGAERGAEGEDRRVAAEAVERGAAAAGGTWRGWSWWHSLGEQFLQRGLLSAASQRDGQLAGPIEVVSEYVNPVLACCWVSLAPRAAWEQLAKAEGFASRWTVWQRWWRGPRGEQPLQLRRHLLTRLTAIAWPGFSGWSVEHQVAAVRAAPSWAVARTLAIGYWQTPSIARTLLVISGRQDAPWWAWAQLFHRAALVPSFPVLPWPDSRPLDWSVFGRLKADPLIFHWRLFRGSQPEIDDVSTLAGRTTSFAVFRQWLGSHPRRGTMARDFIRPAFHDGVRNERQQVRHLLSCDPAQRSWALDWHAENDEALQIYHDGPWADRLSRWVRFDLRSLAEAAEDWARHGAERDRVRRAYLREVWPLPDLSLPEPDMPWITPRDVVISQIAARSTLAWAEPLLYDAPRAGAREGLHDTGVEESHVRSWDLATWRRDMVALGRDPAWANRPLAWWGWWASERPPLWPTDRGPVAACVLWNSLRFIGGQMDGWADLVRIDPLAALRLLERLEPGAWPSGFSRLHLKPLLLHPEHDIRSRAVGILGQWSASRLSGERSSD